MLRELKTLLAVAREVCSPQPATSIGLTQAAVSAQMQRLEGELGFQLFDRTGRSARLNALGHQTLAQAQELLRLYGNLGSSDAGRQATAVPPTLGAIASVQRSLLPDALGQVPQTDSGLPHEGRSGLVPGTAEPGRCRGDRRWRCSSGRRSRCTVTCAGPRSRTSRFACSCRGTWWATTGPSCCPASRSSDTTAPRLAAGRSIASSRRTPSVQQVREVDELDAIVRLVANGVGVAWRRIPPRIAAGPRRCA